MTRAAVRSAPRETARAGRDAGRALRRVPRAAWICALVACLNAVCWSILTPPFQVPDEPDHFAYVKQLAETGRLPTSHASQLSKEELAALEDVHAFQLRQQPQNRAFATEAQQRTLERGLAAIVHERGSPDAGVAASQPPLYYALEAIPYELLRSATVLSRLALLRLMSTTFAALTAMFVFLFIREALPGVPWAWSVGGLSVALAPLLAEMSGAVNPDSLLFAVSAAIFWCLARAFNRGLGTRGALAIGALTALGLLSKLNFIGLAPGVLLGLVVLSVRAAQVRGRRAYRSLALGAALAASPVLLYAGINAASGRPLLGAVSSAIAGTRGSPLAEIDYVWQLYLPRLPGTSAYFPGLFTTKQLWFNGFVGVYGWLDTPFPGWVYSVALVPAGALALLCGRALVAGRAALRARAGELAVYAAMAAGLLLLIGASSYHSFPATDAEYAQARYLLPLLAPLGAALALAARGAGRRRGPIVGVLIVVLFLAHDAFSQLQVIARYYG